MIFFGWGKKNIALGELGMNACQRCGMARPFRAILSYSYFRLYFIFGAVTKKRFVAACNICGHGALLEQDKIAPLLTGNPIPFMDRWGLGLLVGSVTAIVLTLAAVGRT
jgi:hypothetical protein